MKPLFWCRVAVGVAVAVVSSFGMLCLFTLICLRMDDPSRLNAVFSRIALFVGAFLGGRITAKGSQNAALSGIVCGACYALLVLIPSVILSSWGAKSLLWALLTVVSSLIGARSFRGDRVKSGYRKRREASKRYGSYV